MGSYGMVGVEQWQIGYPDDQGAPGTGTCGQDSAGDDFVKILLRQCSPADENCAVLP